MKHGPYTINRCSSMLSKKGSSNAKLDRKLCEDMAKISHNEIPRACKEFASVIKIIQRLNSNRSDHAIAFEGMNNGAAQAAMHARQMGHLNPMQIQRRMTNRSSSRVW